MTASEPHGPVITVMLTVSDASTAARWYAEAIGATELRNLGGVFGLTVEGAPFLLGEPENNGRDTPTSLGSRTVRVEIFGHDPDRFIERALAAGADGTIDEIRDHQVPWGVRRQGGFIDPFGHLWLVGDSSPSSAHPSPGGTAQQCEPELLITVDLPQNTLGPGRFAMASKEQSVLRRPSPEARLRWV